MPLETQPHHASIPLLAPRRPDAQSATANLQPRPTIVTYILLLHHIKLATTTSSTFSTCAREECSPSTVRDGLHIHVWNTQYVTPKKTPREDSGSGAPYLGAWRSLRMFQLKIPHSVSIPTEGLRKHHSPMPELWQFLRQGRQEMVSYSNTPEHAPTKVPTNLAHHAHPSSCQTSLVMA